MGITLIQAINDFINNEIKYSSYSKTTLRNLFGVTGKKDPKPYAFRSQELVCNIETKPISSPAMCEILPEAIRSSIRSYPRNKETAVKVYVSFLKHLRDKHFVVLDARLPTIAIWSSLERQLYITKTLHDRQLTSEQFADELLVSSRTIESDFQKLRGESSDPLLVMGQQLSVDFDRSRGAFPIDCTSFVSDYEPDTGFIHFARIISSV